MHIKIQRYPFYVSLSCLCGLWGLISLHSEVIKNARQVPLCLTMDTVTAHNFINITMEWLIFVKGIPLTM